MTGGRTVRLPSSPGAHLGWDAARSRVHAAVPPLEPREVDIRSATGTRLAAPLVASAALPAVDRSAMDGYAVAGAGPWTVSGTSMAGDPLPPPLRSGRARRVVTGSALPLGTTAVLPQEDARRHGEVVTGQVRQGQHLRRAGEECAAGEELLPAGAILRPAAVGLAAAAGRDTLWVRPAARVAVLVTGDELVHHGLAPDGRVRDALGPALPGLITDAGGRYAGGHTVPDAARRLHEAIDLADADVVIVTGASGPGPADHLRTCLQELEGHVLVDGVACRPGHPQLAGLLRDRRVVLGLSGNPLAAVAAVATLLAPVLAALAAAPLPRLPRFLAAGLVPRPDCCRLVPVVLRGGGLAVPVEFADPGMLRGVAQADGLAVVDPGTEPPASVRVHAL